MPIEFGAIDHVDRQDRPIHETYDSRLRLVQLCEQAGFSTFHITEHHFTPLGLAPSPLIFLAAASRITQRIRFAPLVLITTLYHPLRLAEEICMLDHLTKGRIEIGTGRGISPYELGGFNIRADEAPAIYRESVEVLLAALTSDEVHYEGKYFRHAGVPIELRPLQKPHPPLWYGTASPETAAHAARQNASIVSLQPAAQARVPIARYKAEWEAAHGHSGRRMPKAGITRHVCVAETDREAEERGNFGFEKFYDSLAYLWRKHGAVPLGLDDPERVRKEALIAGSPGKVADEIGRQIEESGANYFAARFAYGNLAHEESVRSLDLFATKVMPQFQ